MGASDWCWWILGVWCAAKMSSTKDESNGRNICRIGCGRPGQRDYGWKGSAFNCCFGTVACLVEHKRPVRHASVARSCEYLPEQWNAPLSPHLPYKLPALTPSHSLHFPHLCSGLTHLGATRRHTGMYAQQPRKVCWELFDNICTFSLGPFLLHCVCSGLLITVM